MKISKDTIESTIIVVPSVATERELFAACELRKYLFKLFNKEISIVNDITVAEKKDSGEPSDTEDSSKSKKQLFLIGSPKKNSKVSEYIDCDEFKVLVSGPEGFIIKSFKDDVILIAGSEDGINERERGTIYGVYEFLEKYMGFSFVSYGGEDSKIGEYTPEVNEIYLADIEYIKKSSDLSYRTSIIQFNGYGYEIPNSDANHPLTCNIIDWMAKNRLNRVLLPLKSYEQIKENGVLKEIVKRGISVTVGHHDSGMFFLPPNGNDFFKKKYFSTNKEFYKLTKENTRFFPKSKWEGQLIFDQRNVECINQISRNISSWLDENKYVDCVNLWPNDMDSDQCCCDKCTKHSKMTNYSYFVNEIAKLIAKEHPDVKIDMLVYLDLWEPPLDVELCENVLVEIATWGPKSELRRFGTNDGSGLIGTKYESNAVAWSKTAKNVVYYDYYMTNFRSKQVYCPMADEIIKICESITDKKYVKGTGTQIEAYNIWNYLFNFYTHGRKSYDISLTMDDLLERFTKIFGKGAQYIKEYIDYIEKFYDGQVNEGRDGTNCAWWFATHVDSMKVYSYFEKAFEAETREDLRDNIRALRMAFRYSDLMTNNPNSSEIPYISSRFGSYWGSMGQKGIGIASIEKPLKSDYIPDKWYSFFS